MRVVSDMKFLFPGDHAHTHRHTYKNTPRAEMKCQAMPNALSEFSSFHRDCVRFFFSYTKNKPHKILLQQIFSALFSIFFITSIYTILTVLNTVWLKMCVLFFFQTFFYFVLFSCCEIVITHTHTQTRTRISKHSHHHTTMFRWSERWCIWLKCSISNKLATIKSKSLTKWTPFKSNQMKRNTHIYLYTCNSCHKCPISIRT